MKRLALRMLASVVASSIAVVAWLAPATLLAQANMLTPANMPTPGAFADEAESLIVDPGVLTSEFDAPAESSADNPLQCSCLARETCRCGAVHGPMAAHEPMAVDEDWMWLEDVRVGYDGGFVIASRRGQDLRANRFPFRLKINGWGQLRHTITDYSPPNRDLNEFQLKRGRLVFSGTAFNPNTSFFIQIDGRSSSGDDIRLLDYYLSYDIGNEKLGWEPGLLGIRTGKYKVPFTMARWLTGRQFEFTDRSVASTFFDVNRSFALGLYGQGDPCGSPSSWELAIFNGLVTGGAETGSSGTLDDNFAVSGRIFTHPIGDWGASELADFENHQRLAMRFGGGLAITEIDRAGTTEFSRLLVVDSGRSLSTLLPESVQSYGVSLFCVNTSAKYRGWSSSIEYYFRNIDGFVGAPVPNLFDHGFWFQLGKFLIPGKFEVIARWSRVEGNSGTLGSDNQSAEEVAGALAWYFRGNHSKLVLDVTHLDGAPVNSSSLDIAPGNQGWLWRSQIQFSF